MRKCPACQAECAPDNRFCMECGASLLPVKAEEAEEPAPARSVSSFGVVQSAMAAKENSPLVAPTMAAPSTRKIADIAPTVTTGSLPAAPTTSKLLKVDVSKRKGSTHQQSANQQAQLTRPLLEFTENSEAKRPFSIKSESVGSVDTSDAPPLSSAVTTAAAGGKVLKDTGELHRWVENSVAQWGANGSDESKSDPASSAPRLLDAKSEPSPEQRQEDGAIAAAAAPFSASVAAAVAPVAPPPPAPETVAAPRKAVVEHTNRKAQFRPTSTSQPVDVAKEEQKKKLNNSFYSGMALGCCGGVTLLIISGIILSIIIGAAFAD